MEKVPEGLENAVTESKMPFDPIKDVLVCYVGQRGCEVVFLVEREFYDNIIFCKQYSFTLDGFGYVGIQTNDDKMGLHCAVLGLTVGDGKVGRHRVDGSHGKLDNRKRV